MNFFIFFHFKLRDFVVLVVYLLFSLLDQICYAFGVFKQLMRAVFVILIFIMLLLQNLDDVVPVLLKLEAILDI